MRTKYHIRQQVAVEFGRVSVNTGAILGEASRDARLFAGSKTIRGCKHREMLVFFQGPKQYQNVGKSRYYNML